MNRPPRTPGELHDGLMQLPIRIESRRVALAEVPAVGYYEGAPRPTAMLVLEGKGHRGRGECVAWCREDQERFRDFCHTVELEVTTDVEGVSREIRDRSDDPYQRAAFEAAAIDLALRQAETNLFELAHRPVLPVRWCWSLAAMADPLPSVRELLSESPGARIKLDVDITGWSMKIWASLASTDRIVVLDFKRGGDFDQILRAHRSIPDAWIEDPPPIPRHPASESATKLASVLGRVSLDGYVDRAEVVENPPFPVAGINIKAPRMGGALEALQALEACRRRGLAAYMGGMFEVGVGRDQARVLASLFTNDAWNDLAPIRRTLDEPRPIEPIVIQTPFSGFAPFPQSGGGGDDSAMS